MATYKTNIKEYSLVGMLNGIKQAAKAVKGTMGAAGKNVVIEVENEPYHLVTNDGATIIEHIYLEDPVENIGLQFLKEVVSRSNKTAGDGSSTTTLLVEQILEEGMKHSSNGMEIMHSLNECLPLIEKSIDSQKKLITSDDYERLKQVATVSSEDESIGELLAEIYQKIGTNGIINPEYILGKQGNSYDFIQGVRFAFGTGYLSSAMVHDEEAIKENRPETRAVYENPIILVTKRKITNVNEVNGLLQRIGAKKDIVIFTDDMDSQVAKFMVATHKARKANPLAQLPRITIVKAPVLWKNYVFEDFAKCVGATIIEDATGLDFKNVELKHLGTCDKIIVEKDETILIGTHDLTEHIKSLQEVVDKGDVGDNDFARRLAWLTSKTVLLKIGGMSDTELSYKRLKLEDAIFSCRGALTDGIVAGGGVALLNATLELPDTLGGVILNEALKSPILQIKYNAGNDNRFEGEGEENGFDAKTGKVVNMFDAGIIDSAKVVKLSVRNAISVCSTLLTADCCIILPPKKEQPIIMPNFPMMQ